MNITLLEEALEILQTQNVVIKGKLYNIFFSHKLFDYKTHNYYTKRYLFRIRPFQNVQTDFQFVQTMLKTIERENFVIQDGIKYYITTVIIPNSLKVHQIGLINAYTSKCKIYYKDSLWGSLSKENLAKTCLFTKDKRDK